MWWIKVTARSSFRDGRLRTALYVEGQSITKKLAMTIDIRGQLPTITANLMDPIGVRLPPVNPYKGIGVKVN